jgi:hypothetical protein
MSHHEDKKNKKKELQKKNRKTQEIFNAFRIMRAEGDRIRDEDEKRRDKPGSPEGEGDKIWSEKVNTLRNKLTGKQRDSKERWNRFAGTEGGGGRGL